MGRCRVSGKEIRHTEGTYAGRRLCFGLPFGLERCQVREFKQPCKLGVTETVCYKAWWLSREGGTVADTAMHLCAWSALHQPLLENLPRRRLGKPRQTLLPPPCHPTPLHRQETAAGRQTDMRVSDKNTGACVMYLEASSTGGRKAVLEGTSEGIEHDSLAGGFRQVGRYIAQQDSGVGADGRLLIHLHTDTRTHSQMLVVVRAAAFLTWVRGRFCTQPSIHGVKIETDEGGDT